MIRTAKALAYYGIFGAMAFTVHAALLWPRDRVPDRQQVLDLARQIKLDLAQLEKVAAPEPPAPPPPAEEAKVEPVKFKETTKVEAKNPEPAPASAAEVPEPKPPEPAPAEEKPAPAPGPKAELTSLQDYRRFLAREMKEEGGAGAYVPKIRFGDNTAEENRLIMRYFGMELIAYPKSQKFYVYIDPDQNLYSRSNEFDYIRNFSNRVIFRSSPYFDTLRREAARRVGADPETLVVAQLLKPASSSYVAWKQAEVARRAGVAVEDVDLCEAAFARTAFGAWIVKVEAIVLKDGRRRPVEDFEWAKVSGGGP